MHHDEQCSLLLRSLHLAAVSASAVTSCESTTSPRFALTSTPELLVFHSVFAGAIQQAQTILHIDRMGNISEER